MTRLNPEKLHVNYLPGIKAEVLVIPRRYTLTHSDTTGDLFLTIGSDYDSKQISRLYTRLMRDEVLAEWRDDQEGLSLHVYCHVSGGFVFGRTSWRQAIFRREMPLVLEAIRHGDRHLFASNSQLDNAPIWVHFQASKTSNSKIEEWGVPADYRI